MREKPTQHKKLKFFLFMKKHNEKIVENNQIDNNDVIKRKMIYRNYNYMKDICRIPLLGIAIMVLSASSLIITNYAVVDKPFLNPLQIFLYSLIPALMALILTLAVFIAVKCVSRSLKIKDDDDETHRNELQKTGGDDAGFAVDDKAGAELQKTEQDNAGFGVDDQDEDELQKTEEALKQELAQKRKMIIDETYNAIDGFNEVEETNDRMIKFKKDLIKSICGGISSVLHFYTYNHNLPRYPRVAYHDDYTTILSTPFRGVVPLDLAIKLEDCGVVKYLMWGEPHRVVSRGGDEGEQVIKLSKESGNPKIQELVEVRCRSLKIERERLSKDLEEKSKPETNTTQQRASLEEVGEVISESAFIDGLSLGA